MSEKIFDWLLRLYPRGFRGEYGEAMRQLMRDRLAAERGPLNRLRLWMDVVKDLALSVPREYRRPPSIPAAMGGYRVSEEAIARMARRMRFGHSLPILFSMAVSLGIAWLGRAPLLPLGAVYGTVMLLVTARLLGRTASLKKYWRDCELVVAEDRIEKVGPAGVRVTVERSEVTGLRDAGEMGLMIRTTNPRKWLLVPAALTGYQEVRERVAGWGPAEPSERGRPRDWGRGALRLAAMAYPAALLVRWLYVAIPLAAGVEICLLYLVRGTAGDQKARTARVVFVGLAILLAAKLAYDLLSR